MKLGPRLLLVAVALAVPLTAFAEPTPQQVKQAKAHYAQGKAFLDAKLYDKAVEELEAAYKLSPLPELLFNVAQAYRLANQSAKALAAYQEFLTTTLTGELADEARVHVAELTRAVADQHAMAESAQQQAQAEPAAPEAAPAAPAAPEDDDMAKLQQLAQLHSQGVLSDEEFAAAKAKILGI